MYFYVHKTPDARQVPFLLYAHHTTAQTYIFYASHRKWADDSLTSCENWRESQQTETIASGSDTFANMILSQSGSRAKGRKIDAIT